MAIGIVITLVLIAVAMLNRRKNPFFPERPPEQSRSLRARMRSHRRSHLTPVGIAYHEALHAHGRH
ncbi:MAG: hypothetical protein ACRELY_31445 [Polyangiaceae bacterium]